MSVACRFGNRHVDIFARTGKPLEATKLVEHRIDIGDSAPIYKPPYRVHLRQQPVVRQDIDEMLQEGIIRLSAPSFSAPVVLIEKKMKEGEKKKDRFRIDFRGLKTRLFSYTEHSRNSRLPQIFAQTALPLTMLTRKNQDFIWSTAAQEAFEKLTVTLIQDPILKYLDFSKKFIFATDARDNEDYHDLLDRIDWR
ncbi:hypothetical protein JTB14_020410 [Gonioctena quinquepunctata]|nr:hypothetical protein JTB14_020410 [Gonioctena quinquepunctata]